MVLGRLLLLQKIPPGICSGGQSGMAQAVSPPPAPVGAQRRLTSDQAGRITSNGLQAPSTSHLGPVQHRSRPVGKNLSIFSVSSTNWGVSSHHSALGSHTRAATKKRSGPHSPAPTPGWRPGEQGRAAPTLPILILVIRHRRPHK